MSLCCGGASVLVQAFHSRMLCLLGSHFIPLGIEFFSHGCNDLIRSDIRSPPPFVISLCKLFVTDFKDTKSHLKSLC